MSLGLPSNDKAAAMKINLGTKHFLIGLMDDWEPTQGDPMSYAREIFPNTFEAVDNLKENTHSMKLPGTGDFGITLFVHHATAAPNPRKDEKVRKVKDGYTGAIQIYRTDIMSGQTELPKVLIFKIMNEQLDEQIRRLSLKRSSDS